MKRGSVAIEAWPIAGGGFVISRETKKDAVVVHVVLERNGFKGSGECVPLKRYGHTPEKIKADIDQWLASDHPWDRQDVLKTMPAGPARFALDTALHCLEAAEKNISFTEYANLKQTEWETAFTLSGDTPDKMADAALEHRDYRWLKLKLMGDGLDAERLYAVHSVLSEKELLVDANEALTIETLTALMPVFEFCNVVAIEQPLPAGDDEALRGFQSLIPFVADESCHTVDDLEKLVGKYKIVNLKLDKTGGLTHAIEVKKRSLELGFKIMIGCMASTGLSILPACVLAGNAAFTDLDGAALLQKDRSDSQISYRDGKIFLVK